MPRYNLRKTRARVARSKKSTNIKRNVRKPVARKTKKKTSKVSAKKIVAFGAPIRPVPSSFKKNFQNMKANETNYGKYTYQGNIQLRCITANTWNVSQLDQEGQKMYVGSPFDILDAASCVFGIKAASPTQTNTVNNLDDDSKYHFKSIDCKWHFASKSSRVVHIEMYTFTYKNGISKDINGLISDSRASANLEYTTLNSIGLPVSLNYTFDNINTQIEDYPEVMKNCDVKISRFSIQPGAQKTIFMNCFKNKTFDLNTMQVNGVLQLESKGTKFFLFRVMSELSISDGFGAANKVHAFGQSADGGIACRFSKQYRIECPENATQKESKVVVGSWNHVTQVTPYSYIAQQQPAIAASLAY